MGGGRQTKAQLLVELSALRQQVTTLEATLAEQRQVARILSSSESRYHAIIEHSVQGVAVQRHGTVLFANSVLATILGYATPQDIIGQRVEDHIAVEERDRLRSDLAIRLRGEPAPARYECQGIKKDGTPIWLEVAPAVVSWDGESAVLVSLIDITARKQAEQALRQSESLSRTVLQNIHDGVFLIQGSRTLLANEAGAQIVNSSSANVLQKDFLSFVMPNERDRVTDCFRYCQEYGRSSTLDRVHTLSPGTVQERIVELRATTISYGDQSAILVTLRDVTIHTRAEETIKEEAEIAAALARVGQTLIALVETPVILDRLCRLTTEVTECDCSYAILWDPQKNHAVTIVGYGDSPEQEEAVRTLLLPVQVLIEHELTRDSSGEIKEEVRVDERPTVQALLHRIGIVSAVFFILRRGMRTTGALGMAYRRQHEFAARQKRLARGIARLASFALTNAKLLEELENSNQLKEDFVGTMSHELRTPLHILYGYTELLQDEAFGPLTPQQVEILARIEKNVRELTMLINTTLDLSRLQSKRIPLSIQEVHIAGFLAELASEIQQMEKSTNVMLKWFSTPELPPLWTDVAKLKIILKNLLINALKFTEAGTITVSVVPQGDGITFSVSDTGLGIPANVLPFIFEPFRQGGNLATRKQGGVGLGLYIVRQLLNLLGGSVTVESVVGKGSTFRVWLPINARSGE